MFGGRFSSSCGALGVDIGSSAIKMLQLRMSGDSLQVVGAAEEVLPRTHESASSRNMDDHMGERLRAVFTAGGFAGRQCIISLPRDEVKVQAVRIPRMPEAELRQAAAWEAAERFGFSVDAMEVDVLRTGATGRVGGMSGGSSSGQNSDAREEVLIIAAAHEAIHKRLKPIFDAGLRPIAIDTHFAALARIYSRRFRRESDRQHVRAVLEVGYSGSTVLVLRGDQIAFCKPIDIGGRRFNEAVAEHLQMEVAAAEELRASRILRGRGDAHAARCVDVGDELARIEGEGADASTDRAMYEATRPLLGELVKELTLCLRYYGVTFRGKPPFQIILTGGDSLEPHLADMLSTGCKLPVVFDDECETLSNLIPGVRTKLHRAPGPATAWAVAAGLSAREIREAALPDEGESDTHAGDVDARSGNAHQRREAA